MVLSSGRDLTPFLLLNGHAVLAPNSFSRKYKLLICNPLTHTSGLHGNILAFRLAEASYAHKDSSKESTMGGHKRNIDIFVRGSSAVLHLFYCKEGYDLSCQSLLLSKESKFKHTIRS